MIDTQVNPSQGISPPSSPLQIKPVQEAAELEQAQAIRCEVFHREQGVDLDLEMDGLDGDAAHFLAYWEHQPVATARVRILPPQSPNLDPIAKIERMAVLAEFRGQSIGYKLLQFILESLATKGIKTAKLHAQLHAQRFYQKLGFTPIGDHFLDAGIEHVTMIRPLINPLQ